MKSNESDMLNAFANNAENELGSKADALDKNKEKIKTVGIRESDYDKIRIYAFKNRKKIVDALHIAITNPKKWKEEMERN